MTPDAPLSPDDSVTAAELALGLLDGDERAAALRRSLADPAFAHEVERWRDHFATLFAVGPDATPSPDVEHRVLRDLDDRRHWRGWRTAALALGTLAAALVIALLYRGTTPPPPTPRAIQVAAAPPLAAAMTPTDRTGKAVAFSLLYDAARHQARLAGPLAVPAGRSAELWTIGANGVPRSLGILSSGRTLTIRATDRARLRDGITLAISIEPRGGSPTGVPTGPVVATGTLATT